MKLPLSGAEGGCGSPETPSSASQQQTWRSQQGRSQRCVAKREQRRSRALPSPRAESGVPCAPWCCSPDCKAPSSTVSPHHPPQRLKLSSNLLFHATLFPAGSDQQPACSICGLLTSSFHGANHVCVHRRTWCEMSREPALLSFPCLFRCKGAASLPDERWHRVKSII